jgi:hypothetical protein
MFHQGKNTNDTNSSNSVPDMAVEPRINQSPSEFLTTPVATSTSISAPGTSIENVDISKGNSHFV